ncbi:MAG TPA: S41 family peptidase, partial [Flavobacteriaceae bacterium]|nr:S41 family peptidase [Flavobacteriaceae bacterium]
DVSSDEKKIAFVSRGRLFVSDVEGKFIQQIKTNPNEAVQEVKWLKNNKTLLFTQTQSGYYNLFTIDASSTSNQKQLSNLSENHRQLALSNNETKAVYLKGRNDICLLNLNTFKTEVIVEDELWGFYNATPQFSPNDEYITYNAYRDFETDVFVYNIKTKKVENLTITKVTESNPVWSPKGKYIYFASDRENPSYPFGTSNAKIYQMALDKYNKPFKVEKVNSLFKEEEDKKEDKKDAKKEQKELPSIRINTNNIMKRLTLVSPEFGQQSNPNVIQQKDKTYIIYTSNHSEGKSQLWKTTLEDFEKLKMERIDDKVIRNYQLDKGKKNYYILTSGTIHTFDVASNKLKPIATNFKFNKTYANEFEQMYYEAWAGMEENFYNEDFHGQNWQKLREEYAKYIPFVTSRAQLRLILNDMLGELNTSHFGFNSSGKEEKTFHGNKTLATGIVFSNENPFTVERIINFSPVDVKDNKISKGAELIKVNGILVDKSKNREYYFTSATPNEELTLTFKNKSKTFDVNIHPISTNTKKTLLYNEWQESNQNYIDKNSNNQIAYVHMKNMTELELEKFKHDLVGEEAYKKGLILDLRYNTGGNVHDEVLKFLSQKTYLYWKYREGKKTGQSNFGYGDKPIVLLINEQSLSDAEMTAAGFKQLGLGTIVGTETYRWIIFTSGKSLVDGSYYRLPSWGCYTLDGDNLEQTGVKPDVYVGKNFKDRLQNNHPQLDKAIEIIKNQF